MSVVYIVNDKTELWIKRNLNNEYFYKRTESSGYSLVSSETYKEIIREVITQNVDAKAIKVYKKVFEDGEQILDSIVAYFATTANIGYFITKKRND